VLLKNEACLVWEAHKEQDERFRETWLELSGGNKNNSHGQAKLLQRNSNTFVNTIDLLDDDEVEQQQPGTLDRIASKDRNPQSHIRFDLPQAVEFCQGASAAEEMINNAKTDSTPNQVGEVYPTDPKSGQTSDFPIGFRGCMRCGDENHRFSECKSRSGSPLKALCKLQCSQGAHCQRTPQAGSREE
jgi:hypothetical protein